MWKHNVPVCCYGVVVDRVGNMSIYLPCLVNSFFFLLPECQSLPGIPLYRSFINLISDSDSDWEKDPAVQSILHQTEAKERTITK